MYWQSLSFSRVWVVSARDARELLFEHPDQVVPVDDFLLRGLVRVLSYGLLLLGIWGGGERCQDGRPLV